jgi:hypothetical protein
MAGWNRQTSLLISAPADPHAWPAQLAVMIANSATAPQRNFTVQEPNDQQPRARRLRPQPRRQSPQHQARAALSRVMYRAMVAEVRTRGSTPRRA